MIIKIIGNHLNFNLSGSSSTYDEKNIDSKNVNSRLKRLISLIKLCEDKNEKFSNILSKKPLIEYRNNFVKDTREFENCDIKRNLTNLFSDKKERLDSDRFHKTAHGKVNFYTKIK